jgi:hypothetical protein
VAAARLATVPGHRAHAAGPTGRSAARPVWPLAHQTLHAPGDHVTIIGEHARHTAELVLGWLRTDQEVPV